MRFTEVERQTLIDLLLERLDNGTYYGNRTQYYARIDRILKKLTENRPHIIQRQ